MSRIVDNISALHRKELIEFIRSEGKRANTRLVALETQELQSIAYQYVTSKMPNREKLTQVSKSGHIKFQTTKISKENVNQLRQRAYAINNFLNAKTSTVSGTREMYEKAYNTLSNRLSKKGLKKVSKMDFKQIFEHKNWDTFKDKFGSSQAFKMLNKMSLEQSQEFLDLFGKKNIDSIRKANKIIEKVKKKSKQKTKWVDAGNENPFK